MGELKPRYLDLNMYIRFILIVFLLFGRLGLSQTPLTTQDSLFCLSIKGITPPIFPIYNFYGIPSDSMGPHIVPLVDFGCGFDSKKTFKTQLGGLLDWKTSNFLLKIGAMGGITNNSGVFFTNWFDKPNTKAHSATFSPTLRLVYTRFNRFNFQLGFDRNFYGDGNRSLFLSDMGKPYPFSSIRFNLGPLNYQTMLAYLFSPSYLQKFNISHFLTWNVTKRLQINLFESVVFNCGDSSTNRSFDPYYLNPFIFLRPQEYSIGSSDNALIGLGASFAFQQSKLYSQLVVDDILVSSISSGDNYWGNKWGVQIGWKQQAKWNKWKIMNRIETNIVRPYTYSHIGNSLNYSNENTVLAHPDGGNFWELFASNTFLKGRFSVLFEISLGQKGFDEDSISFGGNIYCSYSNRPGDFGALLLQGNKTNFIRNRIKLAYAGGKKSDLEGFLELNIRYLQNLQKNELRFFPVIGIRSRIFNDYRF